MSSPSEPVETSSPTLSKEQLNEMYLKSLSEMEYKAYCIAKSHLGTSFTLEKSNGFLRWKSAQGL